MPNHAKTNLLLKILAVLSVAGGLFIRWWMILGGRVPFNSDEAIVGLMARHILAGERPVFFYGQAYMGSLDAWLNAASFMLLGQSVTAMRVVQSILWIGVVISTYFTAKKVFDSSRAGWWSVLLIGLPPVNQVLYATVTLGGYNEAIIIGLWCVYLAVDISTHPEEKHLAVRCFCLGLLAGFGLWVFGFSLLFSLPAMAYALIAVFRKRKSPADLLKPALLLFAGGCIGAFPWWIYAVQHGVAPLLAELTGSAVDVERGGFIYKIWIHLIGLVLLGVPAALGFRPPWQVDWLMLPLIPVVLFIWVVICIRAARLREKYPAIQLLTWVPALLFVVFLFSSFGVDPSGRYFIPFSLVLTILAGGILSEWQHPRYPLAVGLTAVILIFQAGGTIQAGVSSPNGLTTQFAPETSYHPAHLDQLIEFLEARDIRTGYTDYWTAYPLAFFSHEDLVFIPRLPYHRDFRYTIRDDRYQVYTDRVYTSSRNAFITYQNPGLDRKITSELQRLGVKWTVDQEVEGFVVYYGLSSQVTPEQIGLGGALVLE